MRVSDISAIIPHGSKNRQKKLNPVGEWQAETKEGLGKTEVHERRGWLASNFPLFLNSFHLFGTLNHHASEFFCS